MTTDEFRDFVRRNEVWFRGRLPETSESLAAAERLLGVRLPACLRWLLVEYGYWHGTGVPSLDEAVRVTLEARAHLGLPSRFIIINDLQDAGVVLADTGDEGSPGEPVVYWLGYEDLGREPRLHSGDRFASYGAYVVSQLPDVQDFIDPDHVAYDPSKYPEGGA